MNVKTFILFIILLSSINSSSQDINANYKVRVIPIELLSKDASLSKIGYGTSITSEYKINNYLRDTIVFTVNNAVRDFGPSNLKIIAKNLSSLKTERLDYKYDGYNLYVFLKADIGSCFYLSLQYTYIGTSFMSVPESNRRNIVIFGGDESFEHFTQMFFLPKKIILHNETLRLYNDTNLKAFSTLSEIKRNTKYIEYKFHEKDAINNLSVILIDSNIYHSVVKFINKRKYFFYIRNQNLTIFENNIKKITSKLKILDEYQFSKSDFHIIEFDWRNKKNVKGRTYSDIMLIDISFLSKHYSSFIHEYLHSILNIKYKNTSRNGFYLINESLIEYLAQYIYYHDSISKFNSYFKSKENGCEKDSVKLFNLKSNTAATFSSVYNCGPIYFYKMAKSIGFHQFFNIAITFFIQNKEKSFDTLISSLKKKKVDDEIIDKFMNSVK